jgi:glucose/arabinose dehydrogenase
MKALLTLLLPVGLAAGVMAEDRIVDSPEHRFRVEPVARDLHHPWAIARLPDGRFLVTERRGRLLLLDQPGATPREVSGVPDVYAQGQGGLLDVVLHPAYEENGWIYLAFAQPVGDGAHTAIVRGRLADDRLTDLETIFEPPAEQAEPGALHFGCRLAFDDDGYLFFTIGDRGGPTTPDNPAQDLSQIAGKIHRLHDDGRIPADNPFVDTPGAAPSVWAYGSRNAQGLVYDTIGRRLWSTEHGPRGGDELNLIRRGANLGWPLASHGVNYNGTTITEHRSLPGMDDPVVVWTPVIAASGLAIYHGDQFPGWRGHLFAGGLAGQRVVRLALDGNTVTTQEVLLPDTGRIRDVRAFDDGFLYVVYDQPGKVVRLVPE